MLRHQAQWMAGVLAVWIAVVGAGCSRQFDCHCSPVLHAVTGEKAVQELVTKTIPTASEYFGGTAGGGGGGGGKGMFSASRSHGWWSYTHKAVFRSKPFSFDDAGDALQAELLKQIAEASGEAWSTGGSRGTDQCGVSLRYQTKTNNGQVNLWLFSSRRKDLVEGRVVEGTDFYRVVVHAVETLRKD